MQYVLCVNTVSMILIHGQAIAQFNKSNKNTSLAHACMQPLWCVGNQTTAWWKSNDPNGRTSAVHVYILAITGADPIKRAYYVVLYVCLFVILKRYTCSMDIIALIHKN